MKPLDVAKKCIGKGASKKDINRYLHYLEKAGFICVTYLNKANKSNPVWSALPKARDITGILYFRYESSLYRKSYSLNIYSSDHQGEKMYPSVKHLCLDKATCIAICEIMIVCDFLAHRSGKFK